MKKIHFLKSVSLVMALVLATAMFMTSCTSKKAENKLYVFAYGDYFDPEIMKIFEEETGIEIVYEEYAAPEDMYAKATSGANEYDVICTSDYMVEKLINENLVLPIDYSSVPYFENIGETYKKMSRSFDKNLEYSIPHFWGTVGILYNTEKVSKEDVSSWNVLFDEKYKGKIVMPNSERDSMFVTLKLLGYDLNTKDKNELDKASELLVEQKPLVQSYLLDEAARNKVSSGSAYMSVIYNGEAYLAFEENENLAFSVPQEGTNIWMDSWVIPKSCTNKENAEKFLNFMCREDIATMNFDYIYYSTPNQAVYDSLDEEVKSEEEIFPSEEIIENSEVFNYLGTETEKYYTDLWMKIKAS